MRFLLCLVFVFVFASLQVKDAQAEEAREYTDRFFELVMSNDRAGLDNFDLGLGRGQQRIIVEGITAVQRAAGPPLSYSLVEDWGITENFHRLYYTLNFEAGPLGLAIAVYRADDAWSVVDYRQYESIVEFFDALR